MHRKRSWILSLVLMVLIGSGVAVAADEGVHRTWITIGEPGYVPPAGCDACWDEMVALDLAQHYSRLTTMWSSDCVDWDAFQTQVLPAIAQALAAEADRFSAMLDTIFAMRATMDQAGTLALWEDTGADTVGWPIFPPEFPWPWPWPNCIFFSYALSAGGIASEAAAEIVSHGSFAGLIESDPAALAAVITEAILDAADLVSAPTSRVAMERIATNVVPELLPQLAADPGLLAASQTMLDEWGTDSESPEVPSVLIPVDDPFDSEQYEIRDWMDYVQTAAAVIAAGAAIAALCM
ncbi:hypothetical protein JW848_07875 [Candidatus Bipolaricaulota bacterium]|nr:hypothetical protein [Candidatus Bipolaricaulota bacterium]